MVSTLEKRIMLTKLASKCASSKACKLCHGPLTSPTPHSPPTRARSMSGEVDCHPSCLPFACPGCVEKDRSSYGISDLSGSRGVQLHCDLCVEEDGEGWNGRLTRTTYHSGNSLGLISPSSSTSSSPFSSPENSPATSPVGSFE